MKENKNEEENSSRSLLEEAFALLMEKGYQVDSSAFEALKTHPIDMSPINIAKTVLKEIEISERPIMFITKEMIDQAIISCSEPDIKSSKIPTSKVSFTPFAKEIDSEIKIIEDPSETLDSKDDVEYFVELFRNRFDRVGRLLRQRLDARDAIPISAALESPQNQEVRIIGVVTEKRETSKATIVRIEDPETQATVIVPSGSRREVRLRVQGLLLDQIICVVGKNTGNRSIIASDVIVPDIPERKLRRTTSTVMLALTSDLHIGSNTFLEKTFDRFLCWLDGQIGGERERELSSYVKYLLVAGDLVDGIGIYPDQERELTLQNIYEQYKKVGEFISRIPDYIEIIIVPGNHDAVRQALPQPAIPREYLELLSKDREIISLGNPSTVEIHGARILLFHGRSLEDVIRTVPGLSYHQPQKAMEYLLKARHVAPTYGGSTPIAPEREDHLIIEEPPEIFHSGHVHVNGYVTYRGTLVVNSGAWQSQTDYQRKLGLMPTPCKVPIVNLQNMHLAELDFLSI
jgi:DNA polymerase II small subunit